MIRSSAAATEAAAKLRVHRDRLETALCQVNAAFGGAGQVDHVPGPVPVRGEEAVQRSETRSGTVAHLQTVAPHLHLLAALDLAIEAFTGLAAALDEHGTRLSALIPQRPRDHARRVSIRTCTDALSEADAQCRRTLEQAVLLIPAPGAVTRAGGWLRALLPQPAASALTDAGALPTLAQLRHDEDLAESAPVQTLRAVLAADTPDTVTRRLHGCPDLGVRFADAADDLPGGSGSVADCGLDRSAAQVQAAFAHLDQASVRRWSLLWPAVIGPLDGAPLPARVTANRILIRARLASAGADDVRFEDLVRARHEADSRSWITRSRGRARAGWLERDGLRSVLALTSDHPRWLRADLRVRIRLYQALLNDRVRSVASGDTGSGALPVPTRHRRVLLFDPSGPGRLAELWGPWIEDAARVVVFVPGTGTAVAGFHEPSRVARHLAEAAPDGRTAAIAWMGCDFPQAVGNQATTALYALNAAAALVEHVDGLGVPDDVPVTLIGHSYGATMVGAAERLGVRADRVVHLASPGAGPGVRSVGDYASVDTRGRPRTVRRYCLTAPGDPVRWVRRPGGPLGRILATTALGVDPTRLEGMVLLDSGVWEEPRGGHRVGQRLRGPSGHADVTRRGTSAFRRLAEVVHGDPPALA